MHRGFKCLDTCTGKIFVSQHVIFDENSFPFASSQNMPNQPNIMSHQTVNLPFPLLKYDMSSPFQNDISTSYNPLNPTSSFSPASPPHSRHMPPSLISSPSVSSSPEVPPNSSIPTINVLQTARFLEDAAAAEHPDPHTHQMRICSKNNIVKPKAYTDGTVRYLLPQSFLVVGTVPESSSCYTEACKHSEWRAAMDAEFTALMKNDTWSLVPAKPSINIVGSKWIFKSKHKSDGSLERRKARLVSKGYHQQPSIDFEDTFNPVIKPTTIRLVLSCAISKRWPIHQIDIQNAFLHGNLSEKVYMHQPLGYVHPNFSNHIYQLHKALYGLKQAPRAWYHWLQEHLLSLGFINSSFDTSLFIYRKGSTTLFVLVYVDDILITGSSAQAI